MLTLCISLHAEKKWDYIRQVCRAVYNAHAIIKFFHSPHFPLDVQKQNEFLTFFKFKFLQRPNYNKAAVGREITYQLINLATSN